MCKSLFFEVPYLAAIDKHHGSLVENCRDLDVRAVADPQLALVMESGAGLGRSRSWNNLAPLLSALLRST
jgi:hypothetical protein